MILQELGTSTDKTISQNALYGIISELRYAINDRATKLTSIECKAITTADSPYNDVNTFPNGEIVSYGWDLSNSIVNVPNNIPATVFTFYGTKATTNVKVQFWFGTYNSNIAYYRMCAGNVWTSWKTLLADDKVDLNQGVANAGNVLIVGDDGNVINSKLNIGLFTHPRVIPSFSFLTIVSILI